MQSWHGRSLSWCRCGSRGARLVSSEYSNVGCLAHAEHSHSVVCLSVGTLAASREQQRSHGWAIPVLTHGWVGTKSAAAWVGQEYSGGGRRACESASWRKGASSSCASADGCMRRRCRRRASAMPKRATAGARRSAGRTNEQTNEQANEQTNKQTNNHVDERRGEPSTGAGVNYCRCGRGEPRPGAHAAAGAEEWYPSLGRRTASTAVLRAPTTGPGPRACSSCARRATSSKLRRPSRSTSAASNTCARYEHVLALRDKGSARDTSMRLALRDKEGSRGVYARNVR